MGFPLKALLVLAAPMLVLSWFVMIVINTVTVSYSVLPVFRHFEDPDSLARRKSSWQLEVPGDTVENLVWFLQITDLHISEYYAPDRLAQLRQFCMETVDAIRPAVVISSGDLTDAKEKTNFGSRQSEWEWKEYAAILKETRVTEKTTWLDIRGNHDTFNVPSRNHRLNYYRTHAPRGNFTSYHHVHQYGGNSLSFIALDACPDPGFRRPFNFFGVVTEAAMEQLAIYAQESKKSNVTIWFGHYPTSVISSPDPGINHLMSGAVAYLSGHLHTLGGLAPELYALQKSGTLELELGDWKDNRLWRLLAIDHDLLSFSDQHFNEWPVGLITNPKNVRFYAPVHEPLDRISRSTHVRIIAFSPWKIQSVRVLLPDRDTWVAATRVGTSPLFVLPWDPSLYMHGTHLIRVNISDTRGNTKEISQSFATLQAEVPAFGIMRRLILMSDIGKFFATLSMGLVVSNLVVLSLFGTGGARHVWNFVTQRIGQPVPFALIRELNVVLNLPWLFWTLTFCLIYTVTMPWFFGEIVEGSYGVVFAFGIFMNREWLQGQMTYMFAATHLILHVIPLIYCSILYARSRLRHPRTRPLRIFYHFTFIGILVMQWFSLKIFADSYGIMSVLTNGLLVWSGMVPTVFLWWKNWHLSNNPQKP